MAFILPICLCLQALADLSTNDRKGRGGVFYIWEGVD